MEAIKVEVNNALKKLGGQQITFQINFFLYLEILLLTSK